MTHELEGNGPVDHQWAQGHPVTTPNSNTSPTTTSTQAANTPKSSGALCDVLLVHARIEQHIERHYAPEFSID